MAEDLQTLPVLWAGDGDAVLLTDNSLMLCGGGAAVHNLSASDTLTMVDSIEPWGWNPLIVHRLRQMGMPASLLPTGTWLEAYRGMAGRATAADILHRLLKHPRLSPWSPALVGEAMVCRSIDDARQAHSLTGSTLFKQPWSGSGRGLHPATTPTLTQKDEAWLQRTLRTQGYVMAEPIYNKAMDIAAEFLCHTDGHVTYEGLSLFLTTPGGVYNGNLIAPEERKRDIIARHIPPALMDTVVEVLQQCLATTIQERLTGQRTLPVGVDMMILEDNRLHPCVEVNWRMTMGTVALHLQRRQNGHTPSRHFNIRCNEGRYEAVVEDENHKIDDLLKKKANHTHTL